MSGGEGKGSFHGSLVRQWIGLGFSLGQTLSRAPFSFVLFQHKAILSFSLHTLLYDTARWHTDGLAFWLCIWMDGSVDETRKGSIMTRDESDRWDGLEGEMVSHKDFFIQFRAL